MQKKLNPFMIIEALLCFLCLTIIMIGTHKYGPGLSHDSAAYIFAAKSMASGNGLQYFAYTSPFMQWPPLFPALLSIAEFFKADIMTFSRVINALFMSGAIFISAQTIRRITRKDMIPTLFALLALLSFPLIKMSFYMWSEPLFIFLTAAIFHMLVSIDFNGRQIKPVIIMGVLTALACLTRYVGVFVLISACLYIFLRTSGLKNKIKTVFIYGLISSLPAVLYIIRNYIVSKTLVGMRSPSGISFMTNVERAAKTLAGWLFPSALAPRGTSGLVLVIFALVAIMLSAWLVATLVKDGKRRGLLGLLAFYSALYTLQMIVSATNVAFDPIGDRYMIPVFVPLLMIILVLFDVVTDRSADSRKSLSLRIVKIASIALFSGFLLYYAVSNGEITKNSVNSAINNGAGGYNSDYWHNHSVLSDIEKLSGSDMVYSNNPEAVYLLSGMNTHYMPKLFGLPMYGYDAFLKESENYPSQYIVWFGGEASKIVYTPDQIKKDFKLTEISKTGEYVIYRMEKEVGQ